MIESKLTIWGSDFILNDEQARWLAEQSYWVDDKKTDKPYTPEKGKQYYYNSKHTELGKYEVLKVKDNSDNGLQAMAVAPVDKAGKVDTSEVVIAYAGTNADDTKDIQTDIQTVVFGSDELTLDNNPVGSRMRDIEGNGSGFNPDKVVTVDAQSVSALEFAKEIKNEYKDAVMTTTGHSLGEYLALLVAAENKWRNVGFNGADPYGILSNDAKEWIEKNPGMLTNYRNRGDAIRLNGNGTGAEIMISMEMGLRKPLDYHSLSHWEFDVDGKLKIPNNDYNSEATLQQAERYLMTEYTAKVYALKVLEKKFLASGGGLSENEQIYLDDKRALAVIKTAKAEFNTRLTNVIKIYQDGIQEAETLWCEALSEARSIGDMLEDWEILEEMESVGCSEKIMVTEPSQLYQEKINKSKTMAQKFESLANEINAKISELVQRDQELAQQLKE